MFRSVFRSNSSLEQSELRARIPRECCSAQILKMHQKYGFNDEVILVCIHQCCPAAAVTPGALLNSEPAAECCSCPLSKCRLLALSTVIFSEAGFLNGVVVASLSDMGHFKSGFNGRQSNISDTGKKLESVIETRRVNPAQSMEEEQKRRKRKEERRRMKKEKEKKQFV